MDFSVCFALHPKKAARYITEKLVKLALDRGIEIVEVDRNLPLENQGPWDILIHKYGEDKDWEESLEKYSVAHPETLIVDPINNIQRLRDRTTMLALLNDQANSSVFQFSEFSISIPKQVVFSIDSSPVEVEIAMRENEMTFPLVLKPRYISGDGSHMLAFVKDIDGLKQALDTETNAMTSPFVAQEFVEHNSILFKVYVVGDRVECCARPSLDSKLCISPFQPLPRISSRSRDLLKQDHIEFPPSHVIKIIALVLQENLNLQLFNFDLIRPPESETSYFIVDINYFPGIDKLDNFEELFVDFLLKACSRVND